MMARRRSFVFCLRNTWTAMMTLFAIMLVACAMSPSRADAQTGPATGAQSAGTQPARAPAAQTAPAEPAAASSADLPLVGPGLVLSEDALKARLDTVKNASAMGPGARAKAVSSYETALSDLTTAGSLARKAAAFEEARAEAPRMLSDLEHEAGAQLPKTKINRQLSATELEALLHELEDQLGAAQTGLAKIEGEQNKRARRRVESPRQVGDASQEIADLETRLRVAPIPAPNDEVALAERAAMLARHEMLLATLAFNEKELESYDARRELLAAKRDQAIRRIARLTETVHELRDLIGNAQRTEAQRDADKAVATARELAKQHPALRAIAQRNAELAAMRTGPEGLATRIEETRATLADTTADLQRVTERYDRAHEKAEAVGFTPAIGLLLRKEGAELPDLAERQRMLRERHGEIGNVQLRLIELEDERDEIADVDVALRRVVSKVADARLEPREQRRLESTARELLLTYRGYLDSLIDDYDAYFTTLVELDAKEQDLITAVRRYRNYIDEHVLWIRGPSVATARMLDGARGALTWLVRPRNAARLVDGLATTLVVRPLTTALAVLCWVVLFVYRRRIQVLLDELCPAHAGAFGLTFGDTLRAIVLTAALAAIWPGFIALLAYLVSTVEGASGEFGAALGSGLRTTAAAFFVGEFLRRLCKTRGVGEVHLGWSPKVAAPIRRAVASAMLFGLPAVFVVSVFDAQSNDLFKSSVGRGVFLLGMIGLAALTYRVLRGGEILQYDLRGGAAWRAYVSRVAHVALTAAPLILVAMATAGYDFAALSVTRRAAVTLAVALALFLVHSVILRWLALARRRMVVRQARQVEAARQQVEKAAKSDGEPVPVAEADTVDIGAVNAQTRRLVTTFSAAAMLIATWLIWHDVMPALRVFEHIELWNVTQETVETLRTDAGEQQRTLTQQRPVTVADLLAAVVITLLAMAAGRNIVGSSRVDLQACKLEYSIVSPK